MDILIYGAGVQGSRYAVGLLNAGHNVSILERGERLEQLRQHGVVLEAINTGQRTVTRVNIVEKLDPEDAYDLVLVMVRSNQVGDVLPALAANRFTPNVLFLGNNISGTKEIIRALGDERIFMGFAGAAGIREDHIVRYIGVKKGDDGLTYVGEPDGGLERLQDIIDAFCDSGFPVKTIVGMDAWHKTHVALIIPLVYAIYMAGGDNYRLARTRDALVLMVRAVREAFRVMQAHDIPITPTVFILFIWLPEPVIVMLAKSLMNSQRAEIGLAGHANAARDEMEHLADGLMELVGSTSVPTPSLDVLLTYSNPSQPPITDGSRSMPVNPDGIWTLLGVLIGIFSLVGLGLWRIFSRRK
jgi:2-dehydropantoate 2-reductase